MTNKDKEKMKALTERALEAVDIINSVEQELDEMNRIRDVKRFVKAKDLIYEWIEKWE